MTSTGLKILIVEDDYRLASEWMDHLTAIGHQVDHITSANEVLPLMRKDYNCFIIDLFHVSDGRFQEDGGIRIISSIRKFHLKRSREVLIIAVTGYYRKPGEVVVSTEDVVKSLGADVLLKKPTTIEKLMDTINEWVSIKKLE